MWTTVISISESMERGPSCIGIRLPGYARPEGGHSPETWAGTATFQLEGVIPTLVAAGSRTCHPYGDDSADAGEASWEWFYDLETDMLEFAPDGVLYTRSPPPLEGGDSNPFVGSWEATDSDGTRISMMIASDGTWESLDTRSGGCENMGLTYAT